MFEADIERYFDLTEAGKTIIIVDDNGEPQFVLMPEIDYIDLVNKTKK